MDQTKSEGLISAHVAVLLFGAVALLAQESHLSALTITSGRCLFGALTLGLLLRDKSLKLKGLTQLWSQGALLAAHWYAFFRCVEDGSAALALITYATYPLWTLILSKGTTLVRERTALIACSSILLGSILLVLQELNDVGPAILWGVFGALTFAILQIRNQRLSHSSSVLFITFGQLTWASIFLLPIGMMGFTELDLKGWSWLILFGTVFTALAHGLFVNSVSRLNAQKSSFIGAWEPVYGLLLAAIFLGYRPELLDVLAIVLIVGPSLTILRR